MRMESLEVTKQIMSPSCTDKSNVNNATYSLSDIQTIEKGVVIKVLTNHSDDNHDDNINNCNNNGIDTKTTANINVASTTSDYDYDDDDVDQKIFNNNVDSEIQNSSDNNILTDSIKSIDNFSVMKKYIKKGKKKILITVNDVDDAGNIFNTEILQTKEYRVPSNKCLK